MFIRSLSLTNFRSLRRLELQIPEQLTLFFGGNAQGKTSILEAIHFLSLMTSPVAAHDREILNFACMDDQPPVCRIVGEIEKNGTAHKLEIRLIINRIQNGNRRLVKEVLIDGVKRRLYDAVGFFNSVLFLPQMTRIIEDGPNERRRYMDQVISQVDPGYFQALVDYQQGLARRNALLKRLQESGGDEGQLNYWDQLLAEKGAVIMRARYQAARELERYFSQQHLEVTESREVIRLVYQPSFDSEDEEKRPIADSGFEDPQIDLNPGKIEGDFQEALLRLRREEIRRGVTTIGPHRDDLAFIANDIDLRVYGSRGQIRSAVMSLKLAETQWFKQKKGELPVLLLDETLAELDQNRRGKLLRAISNGWQALFTTADLRLFSEEFTSRCAVWGVLEGRVTPNPPSS